jgi:hypothetical protein
VNNDVIQENLYNTDPGLNGNLCLSENVSGPGIFFLAKSAVVLNPTVGKIVEQYFNGKVKLPLWLTKHHAMKTYVSYMVK